VNIKSEHREEKNSQILIVQVEVIEDLFYKPRFITTVYRCPPQVEGWLMQYGSN